MFDALTFVKVLELATVADALHAGHAVVVHPASGQFAAAFPQLNVQSVASAGAAHASGNSANASTRARLHTRRRATCGDRGALIGDLAITSPCRALLRRRIRVLGSPI